MICLYTNKPSLEIENFQVVFALAPKYEIHVYRSSSVCERLPVVRKKKKKKLHSYEKN